MQVPRLHLWCMLSLCALAHAAGGLTINRIALRCSSIDGQFALDESDWRSSSSVEIRLVSEDAAFDPNTDLAESTCLELCEDDESVFARRYLTKGASREIISQGTFNFKSVFSHEFKKGRYRFSTILFQRLDSGDEIPVLDISPTVTFALEESCAKPTPQKPSSVDVLERRKASPTKASLTKRSSLDAGELASIITAVVCFVMSAITLGLLWSYLVRRRGKKGGEQELALSDTDVALAQRPRSLTDLFRGFSLAEREDAPYAPSSTTSSDNVQTILGSPRSSPTLHKSAELPAPAKPVYWNSKLSRSSMSVPTTLNPGPRSISPTRPVIVSASCPARPRPAASMQGPRTFKVPRVSVPSYSDEFRTESRQTRMSTRSEPLDSFM